jgi:hypothetical protein
MTATVARPFRDSLRSCTFDRLVLALFLLVVACAAALSPMQNDTWWQLRAGADMWASHRVMLTDVYSHTSNGAFWSNYEWLAELIFFGVYRTGGLPGLSLFVTTLIAAAWTIVWSLTQGHAKQRLLLLGPVLIPASMHWEPRAHAFTLVFLMAMIALVVRERIRWIPPLFLVWANCHGGVLIGLMVLVAARAVLAAERPSSIRTSVVLVSACLVAMTATPLGVSWWREIAGSLLRIRQYPIDEWRPPAVAALRLLPFWAAAVALAVLAVRNRGDITGRMTSQGRILIAAALVLLPSALSAVRNVGIFLMVAVPAISHIVEARAPGRGDAARAERPGLNAILMATAVVIATTVIAAAYLSSIPRLRWTPLPAGSLAALNGCPGNLYNRYDDGGYLIWFAPGRRVFIDGRQDPYEPSFVQEHIRTETSGDFASTFARYQIGCAFLPPSSPIAVRLAASDWTTLYRDRDWLVLRKPPLN